MLNDASLQAQWTRLQPAIRTKWSRLSEADLSSVNGDPALLAEAVQQRYGHTHADAVHEVDQFCREQGLVIGIGGSASRGATYPHSRGDAGFDPGSAKAQEDQG